jgi:DNA-binding CsgD family transcriptional regulator
MWTEPSGRRRDPLVAACVGVVDLPGDQEPAWSDSLGGDIAWRSNSRDLPSAVATSRVDTIVFHVEIHDHYELVHAIGQARSLKPAAKLLLAAGSAETLVLAEVISVFHPSHASVPRAPVLTAREDQVLREIRSGRTNREIAGSLGISLSTVNRHVESILKKLSARNRAQAVAEIEVLRRGGEAGGDQKGVSVL